MRRDPPGLGPAALRDFKVWPLGRASKTGALIGLLRAGEEPARSATSVRTPISHPKGQTSNSLHTARDHL
jgi:hypothetical protein